MAQKEKNMQVSKCIDTIDNLNKRISEGNLVLMFQ